MNMKAFLRLTFFIPFIAISMVGCSGGTPSGTKGSGQELSINITTEPQTLDPRKVRSLNDTNVTRMFMEGLTRTDKNGSIILAAAESMELSEDQRVYTFKLRKAEWSNGDPVTSKDFAYAWKKCLSPSFLSPNANLLYVIQNAREARNGTLPLSLVGIETPNDATLVVTLSHPTPYFLDLIAHPVYFPVNRKVDQQNAHWAENESTYVGNGPFSLAEWKHQNAITAVKNPTYWDQKAVKLSKIHLSMVSEDTGFKIFEHHESDWDGSPFSTIPLDAIKSLMETNLLQTSPALATNFIRVNVKKTLLESKEFRRALAYAIDRKAIVEHVLQGRQIPATGIVPKALNLCHEGYFTDANIEEARLLFLEASQKMGFKVDKVPELVLTYASGERPHVTAQAIQSQWKEALGIDVRLEPLERRVYFDRVSKQDYMLALGDWFADFEDPINFLEVFTKDAGTNNTNWDHPCFGELLDNSYHAKSAQERNMLLRRSEELLMSEMPVIPMYHYTFLHVQDKSLKNVVLTSMGNIDFKWAYVDRK